MRVYSARDVFEEDLYQHSMAYSRSNSSHSNSDFNNVDVPLNSVESNIPVRKFISVDISNSDSDEDKEEDNDDDVDDGIGSSVDVKICSGKESASPSVNIDMIEYGLDEEETLGQLTQVVSHKTSERDKDSAVVEMTDNLPENKPKKKIIPNEIFKKSSEAPLKSEPVPSSVIKIEEEPKSTIVDIPKLQKDIVLDIEPHDNGEDGSQSDLHLPHEQDHPTETPKRKKKIIPFEFNKSQNRPEESDHCIGAEEDNVAVNGHTIIPPKLSISDEATNHLNKCVNEDDENEDDDVAREVESARLQSSSSELSTKSKELGSTPTPSSRPETPIWDYYDFACDEQAEGDTKNGKSVDAAQSSDSTSKSENAKTSTLQESLARLSRPSATLDTCRVAGPVLPSVIVDDFEMDED